MALGNEQACANLVCRSAAPESTCLAPLGAIVLMYLDQPISDTLLSAFIADPTR